MGVLQTELTRLGACQDFTISTNQPIRKDGQPYATKALIRDPGAAVYFRLRLDGRPVSLACDRWDLLADNLYAIALTIEAMRALERWGASDMLDRVFQGFTALPAPEKTNPWHEVLGVAPGIRLDLIEAAYRAKIRQAHPDAGGSHEEAQRLNAAIAEARKIKAQT